MENADLKLRHLGEAHTLVGFVAMVCLASWHVYRLPFLQARIHPKIRWSALTLSQQWVITVGFSAFAGALTAISTGQSGWEIVRAVLDALINSSG